jgi:gentisate 1,2-dioxygenase
MAPQPLPSVARETMEQLNAAAAGLNTGCVPKPTRQRSAREGQGTTEIGGRSFDWEANDIFVVPNFLWRRHRNRGSNDAILYLVSDQPLLDKIGQYRAQGRDADGKVVQLVV